MRVGLPCALLLGSAPLLVACTLFVDTPSLSRDYRAGAGGGAAGGVPGFGGSDTGGSDTGGVTVSSPGGSTDDTGGSPTTGGSDAGAAGAATECVPSNNPTEVCNGIDDDCDPATPDGCPDHCTGATYDGATYMVCSDSHSWDVAETRCVGQGMHLAEIDGPMENAFVLSLVKTLRTSAWIGASDEAKSRTFAWIGGTTVYENGTEVKGVYQNFDTGEPANMPGPNCLQMANEPAGGWLDAVCTSSAPYVCKD